MTPSARAKHTNGQVGRAVDPLTCKEKKKQRKQKHFVFPVKYILHFGTHAHALSNPHPSLASPPHGRRWQRQQPGVWVPRTLIHSAGPVGKDH